MKYVYPAVFTPEPNQPDVFNVTVPDLPGCYTCGNSLVEAMEMVRDAMSMWLCDAEDKGETIPSYSSVKDVSVTTDAFVNLVDVDTDVYRRENDSRAVKKTLTLPNWLNARAEKAGINFSQTLQKALKEQLGIQE